MKNPAALAFEGDLCLAAGEFACVALAVKKATARPQHKTILMFDASTGEQIDLDLRTGGDVSAACPGATVADQPATETPRRPGRPKLGVIPREVTLLPRHWEWLGSQPGGASVALRKLVEHAMRANVAQDRIRTSQNAAYRFMSVMAGNCAGFEEATRALFAGDGATFNRLVEDWPTDIRDHAKRFAADALQTEKTAA
jgi:uncharacterized protein